VQRDRAIRLVFTFFRWSCSSNSACVLTGGICARLWSHCDETYMRYYYAYAVCGKCADSRPLFLALYVVGISMFPGGSLIAGGVGGVLTGCWFRVQLQWCMYWADVQNRNAVMEVLGE
jgi:hypothetical protein